MAGKAKTPQGGHGGQARSSLTREQQRALHAYECATRVQPQDWNDYKVAVHDLGANVLRSGLAMAVAALERQSERHAVEALLQHLAAGLQHLPQLRAVSGKQLAARVRQVPVQDYMLVTREVLRLAIWFKRAVQARSVDNAGAAANQG